MDNKKIAAITFDMDELDILREGYHITDECKPVIYKKAVPRMLEILDEVGIKATFFIISKDIVNGESKKAVRTIYTMGHEVANHSANHRHLFNMSLEETRQDMLESSKILSEIIGENIVGYRGPSLTLNNHLMEILLELGYEYDSTTNPTLFFITEWLYLSLISPSKRNSPSWFFVKHAFAPSTPYRIIPPCFFKKSENGKMIELPISHVPFLQVPFYATFHFLFPFSYHLFKHLYYINKTAVYHAHGLDFLDINEDNIPPSYTKHPGMNLPWSEKKKYFKKVFTELKNNYSSVGTARDMARKISARLI
ncbi:MAG: polysaccharide deacetylase family protein [Nitrospinae bacterium]|nr:polysaccharide deacetylase family protein [Nitrospinota bacterium]